VLDPRDFRDDPPPGAMMLKNSVSLNSNLPFTSLKLPPNHEAPANWYTVAVVPSDKVTCSGLVVPVTCSLPFFAKLSWDTDSTVPPSTV
jgi:hypothetical protein